MTKRISTPVGPLLDGLGVRVSLAEGQQLVEVMIVGKIVDFQAAPRHGTSLVLGASSGLDWIAQRGLLAAAVDVMVADVSRED